MKIRLLTLVLGVGLLLTALAPTASAQTAVACEQDYTVAAGDWLSNIGDKFYGSVSAYPAIATATNTKSQTDSSYATIVDPDRVAVGSKLCIPSARDAEAILNPTAPAGLDRAALENATYKTDLIEAGSVTLKDGEYSQPAAPGLPQVAFFRLTDFVAYGDLNGMPSAAVITGSSGGGTGFFYDLHIMQVQDGKPTDIAVINLGDRTPPLVLTVANNQIIVDFINQGEFDGACCPTQRTLNTYTFANNTLALASSNVIGTIGEPSAAARTTTPEATPTTAEPTPAATDTATPVTAEPTTAATEAATPEPTSAASATPAPATNTPPSVTATGLRAEDITFNPVGLGKEVKGVVVPAQPYDNSSPPGPVGAPAHVAYQFDGEDRLWVIPSEEYQAQWNAAGNDSITQAISQLRLLLRDKPESPKPPLPFLPQVSATNDLAARVRYLDFNGGSGISYIGRWAQDPSPVLASQTYYSFLGLTNDGKYIVSFQYPVHTSALPDEITDLTPEHLADIEANPSAYFAETTDILNKLGNSAYGPDLSRLDALVFSLSVPSTGTALPPPSGSLPTPGAGQPTPGAGQPTPGTSASGSTDDIRLRGADWKWVQTKTPTETISVPDPTKYTLRFNNAGGFGITADCNIGAGNYSLKGSTITIEDIQTTLIFCGDDSLDTQFTSQLLSAATYSFQSGNLIIELQDNGGTMTFRR